MGTLVYRVECDIEGRSPVGMFLAEYHTSDESIKKVCQQYRSKAPWMPEPEHKDFSSSIPYAIVFGCRSPSQLMKWFGGSKVLLKEVLKKFKLRVYTCSTIIECEDQVGFDYDETTNKRTLTFEDFNELLKDELKLKY